MARRAGFALVLAALAVVWAVAAWLQGYLGVRAMPDDHLAMTPTLVMLRRINLTAWVVSHQDAIGPLDRTADYGAATARLGERYLTDPSWLRRGGQPTSSTKPSRAEPDSSASARDRLLTAVLATSAEVTTASLPPV